MPREQQFVICPFDRNHKLLDVHLAHHIARCQKNYKGSKIRCPFNALEYVEPEELDDHLKICESRSEIIEQVKLAHNRCSFITQAPPPYFHDPMLTDESWGIED